MFLNRVVESSLLSKYVWGCLSKVIAKESVPTPVAGMFYQAVVVAVLLYGSESWVLPKAQLRALEGFHVECARRLTRLRPRKVKGICHMGVP